MISDIRKQLSGPAFKSMILVVVIGMIAGLVFSTVQLMRHRSQIPWVIKVDNETIDLTEFDHEFRQLQEQIMTMRRQYGAYADMLFGGANTKEFAMQLTREQLIRQTLENQIIRQLGLLVHPDIVADLISNPRTMLPELMSAIPFDFLDRSGSFDCARMNQYLQRAQLPMDFFERKLENAVLSHELHDIIAQAVYIPQYLIDIEFIKKYAPKKFTIYSIPFESIKAEQIKQTVSDEALAQFYNNKKQEYAIPEKRSGVQWAFDASSYGIKVDDSDITSYYQNHKSDFIDKPAQVQIRDIFIATPKDKDIQAIRTQAEDILKKAQAQPNTFAQLAQEYSQDEKSAQKGGLLSPFTRTDKVLAQPIIRAAFLLPQDNAISDLITVPDGFHIIQRVKKEQPTYKSLASVTPQIKAELINKKFKEQFVRDIKHLTEQEGKEKDVAIEKFVTQKGGKLETIALQPQDTNKKIETLFSIPKTGEFSTYFHENKGILVKLNNITKSYEPELSAIREKVTADWQEQQAKKILQDQLKELRKAISQKTSIDELKKKFKLQIKQTPFIAPDKPEEAKEIAKFGLPADQVLHLTVPGSIITKITDKEGVLVRLDAVEPVSGDKKSAKEKEIRAELTPKYSSLLKESFIASLYRNAKIETNERNMLRLQK